jgi:hypothetical protein
LVIVTGDGVWAQTGSMRRKMAVQVAIEANANAEPRVSFPLL